MLGDTGDTGDPEADERLAAAIVGSAYPGRVRERLFFVSLSLRLSHSHSHTRGPVAIDRAVLMKLMSALITALPRRYSTNGKPAHSPFRSSATTRPMMSHGYGYGYGPPSLRTATQSARGQPSPVSSIISRS